MATKKPGDFPKAWEYHQSADSMLHTRAQAHLTAQSFLVVAFVTLVSANLQNYPPNGGQVSWLFHFLSLAIASFGLVVALTFASINRRFFYGVIELKRTVINDPTYKSYLNKLTGSKSGDDSDIVNRYQGMPFAKAIPIFIPLFIALLWVSFLTSYVIFFSPKTGVA